MAVIGRCACRPPREPEDGEVLLEGAHLVGVQLGEVGAFDVDGDANLGPVCRQKGVRISSLIALVSRSAGPAHPTPNVIALVGEWVSAGTEPQGA